MNYHFPSSQKKLYTSQGKNQKVNNHICVLNTALNVVKSYLVAKLILLFGKSGGNSFQNELIVDKTCDKNRFQDFVRVTIARYVCQKKLSNFQHE